MTEIQPNRFVSVGDDEFNDDWEILESAEASDEAEADEDESADSRLTRERVSPPYSGAPRLADQLKEVAKQFGFHP